MQHSHDVDKDENRTNITDSHGEFSRVIPDMVDIVSVKYS